MNDEARAERLHLQGWRAAEVLLERARHGVIDDEAAAQELLDLIDPDRVAIQNGAHDDRLSRGATAAHDGAAPPDPAAAHDGAAPPDPAASPADRPA